MYRRWLYPNFSVPVLDEPAFTDIPEPLAQPIFRKPHPIWKPFETGREYTRQVTYVDQAWEIPRKKPWSWSEFEHFEDLQPPIPLPPWVQGQWEYPYDKTWVRPGLGPNPNPAREPFLGVNWQVPFVIPVHPKPLTQHFWTKTPPPPEIPNPLPFTVWQIPRRKPPLRLWQMFLGNGAGFGYFTPVEWQWPRKKPPSGNTFPPVDNLPLPHLPAPHIETPWQIPKLRVINEYWMPFQGPMEIPEELFDPNTMLCPRPMRRPDTKC